VCAAAFPDHWFATKQDVTLLAVLKQVGTAQQC
jgi:hypothetical protein